MFKVLKEVFSLLNKEQRRRFYILQILIILMAFAEIIGIASIIPFMTLVGDLSILQQDNLIARVYQYSKITSEEEFIFLLGVGVLIMLFFSAAISMVTTWKLSMFSNKVGTEIADRLFTYYLRQGWLFHASGSSAQLTKKIANESQRVTVGILMPIVNLNARIVLVLFIAVAIFLYDPKVAITGLSVFAIAYIFLYKVVRKRLQNNGKAISVVLESRFRLMNEGFGGIKDVLLLGREADFISRFNQTGQTLANSQGTNLALARVPRYFMELLAFGSMIALLLYLIANHGGNLGMILPVLSVYALASFKLLPAFQEIYANFAQIKGSFPAFESIKQDLSESYFQTLENKSPLSQEKLHPKRSLKIENIFFTYPEKGQLALNNLSISINAKSVIGIVGPSGSGKSTLIDVLLGLIAPQKGRLLIDGEEITSLNLRAWQNTIGFVPQSIFLSEGSIAENVAFGVPYDQINFEQVNKALKLAHLDVFVQGLENGFYEKVGERGVQLSGGQRQRIGIARALYHEADVLVFDEATSALDGITEKLIMEAIQDFAGQKTIIMIAHRLKTVEKCDQIFFINQGEVVDKGTYSELISNNSMFKKMAEHA